MTKKAKQVKNILPQSPPDKNKKRGVANTIGLQGHRRRHDALPCMEWVDKVMESHHMVSTRSMVHPLLPKLISAWGEHCPKAQWGIKMQDLLLRIKNTLGRKALACGDDQDELDPLMHPLIAYQGVNTISSCPRKRVETSMNVIENEPMCMCFGMNRVMKGDIISPEGYLLLNLGNGVFELAHRIVCFAFHGPPPSPSHEVLHSCYNVCRMTDSCKCLSPLHLRWGSKAENAQDRGRKKSRASVNIKK
jgi:hypothetical protein